MIDRSCAARAQITLPSCWNSTRLTRTESRYMRSPKAARVDELPDLANGTSIDERRKRKGLAPRGASPCASPW